MKTILSTLMGALVLLAPSAARADDATPTKGKVLLLENERVLEGDIERVGDRYRVQRKIGETWVPAAKALRLSASLDDAYVFLRERANLQDADERLRLANWCQQNGLREQALQEVQAAVALRPDHPFSRRLLEGMQKASLTPKSAEAPPREEPESLPLPAIELTANALGLFTTKVQPILMNTCAGCHATGRGGSFKLLRAFEPGSLARKTTQQNLAAVLAHLDPDQPLNSKLLLKAVSAHGNDMSKAPLAGRDAPPYRVLEDWVRLTVANNPHLQERTAIQPAAFAAETKTPAAPLPAKPEPARSLEPSPAQPTSTPAAPATGPANDPFDPEAFNRAHHQKTRKKG